MKPEDIDDFLVWAAVGIVLGGRVGYILFYDLARYLANPLDIFAVWQGGMSFHGGFAGTTLAMILFARSRGISIWTHVRRRRGRRAGRRSASSASPISSIPSSGAGRPTCPGPSSSRMAGRSRAIRASSTKPRSKGSCCSWCCALLTHRFLKLKTPGFVAGAFVAGYGLSRIFVEFFREPDQQLGYLLGGWLTMGMVLSLPMVLVGVWAMCAGDVAGGATAAA